MVFYAAFNSISVISRRQLTLFMFSWVSPVLGWALKCLAQGHSHEKTQRIQCGSNPGPLDYESNTLPLSHVGPFGKVNHFPNKPWFLRFCSTSLLKTLREKEKLLVTSNFSFSHSVFYPFGINSAIFIKLKIVICKLFKNGTV